MYVALVTRGTAPTLPAAVALMANEFEAVGTRADLHVWVGWRDTVPAHVASACETQARARGIRVVWRSVDAALAGRDRVTVALRAAMACVASTEFAQKTTFVGTTRLLMKREAAGQALVSVDDDIVGACVDRASSQTAPVYTLSSAGLLSSNDREHNPVPAPRGTLLRLLDPATIAYPDTIGPHVLQAGLLGDCAADAPLMELELGLAFLSPHQPREVRRIVPRISIGPMDRLMTYAWSVSPEADGVFFPPAFRNQDWVWATFERARRPSLRLVHVPVGGVHRPTGRTRDSRQYSFETAVLQWRTNDWLAYLCGGLDARHAHPSAVRRAISADTEAEWRDLIERSRAMRRRVLAHRIDRLAQRLERGAIDAGEVSRIRSAATVEYASPDCWIPTEWRATSSTAGLRQYVQATARLADACTSEVS